MLPRAPLFSSIVTQAAPARELALPAPAPRHADYFRLCKALPAGMPDYLEVSITHSALGTERSTAAFYSGRAYLIHLALEPRKRS
jgi:hypothetical protein